MKKEISSKLKAGIKKYIEEYINNDNNPEYLRNVVKELGILLLFLDMGICFGINEDGEIVSFHFDGEFEPYIEKDERNINIALYQGSKVYPELKQLLESKPKDALECHHCGGTGLENEENEATAIVCYCGGLGWLPRTEISTSSFRDEHRAINRI